jgi:creatinine amidohydrolase
MQQGGHDVSAMSWDVVEARLTEGAPALLGIGAGAKEHGLHLPMGTDAIQADWLCRAVAARTGALVWPCMTYGFYPAFKAYPGSITLSRATFVAMLREVAGNILRWKPAGLFVIDTGISTIGPASEALVGLAGAHHVRVHEGPRYRAAAAQLQQQAFGSHADELETSRMLAIAPEQVDMARAQATPGGPFEGPLTRENAPSGSYGDPTLAARDKGEALCRAMVDDVVDAVKSALEGEI